MRARAREGDYSELETALKALPGCQVEYRVPDAEAMAEKLAEKLGVEKEIFQVTRGAAPRTRRTHDLTKGAR